MNSDPAPSDPAPSDPAPSDPAPSDPAPFDPAQVATVLCDLDGVVWLAHDPIPGSVDAIARIRASGRRVLFVTNNSVATMAQHVAALDAIGVPADGDVVSSSTAAGLLVQPGERVLVTGGPGIAEAVAERGGHVTLNDGSPDEDDLPHFDVVVVGLDRSFDYARLSLALAALRGGARLVATNTDATFPTPNGLQPGGGSIVAAVATAAGITPQVAGKPNEPMAEVIRRRLDDGRTPFSPGTVLMVGDRVETDGLMAQRLGCPFALVRSGVPIDGFVPIASTDVEHGDAWGPQRHADVDVADLAAVAEALSTRR